MAKYIIRFDDLHCMHNHDMWEEIEKFLIQEDIRPIIAVIPNNLDTSINFGNFDDEFFVRVKRLQEIGWTIAIHGLNHTLNPCENNILGINRIGEFCDQSFEIQDKSLAEAKGIFDAHGITSEAYCAPAHSFSKITLDALVSNGFTCVTDGFHLYPHTTNNLLWVPQQIWRFYSFPIGVFTVCYHHNDWSEDDLLKFKSDVRAYKHNIIDVDYIKSKYGARKLNIFDMVFHKLWFNLLKFKRRER